jgi:hypothetical protein
MIHAMYSISSIEGAIVHRHPCVGICLGCLETTAPSFVVYPEASRYVVRAQGAGPVVVACAYACNAGARALVVTLSCSE